ncbi:MAG: alpha/beta hydrolase, partial [Streptomycetaceae bacterium]|nr:alpha/beta hydrolase [Streptomycetaceae bacterium]
MTAPVGITRRGVVTAGTAALVGSAVLGTGTAAAGTTDGSAARPTIVLVHGAFVDGSSWTPVVARLQAKGYTVIAAANPLRGLRTDAAHVKSVLDSVTGPVVLVGHSYGGAVITEAAANADNVEALVYIAALVPDMGETSGELAFRFPGSELEPALRQVTAPAPDGSAGVDLYIKPESFRYVYAADSSGDTARVFAAAQRPISASALSDVTAAAAWRTLPAWILVTSADRILHVDLQTFQARRAN